MMHTLHITERTGKDGVLHVSVPLGTPEAAFDVVLVVQPKESTAAAAGEATAWPPGYFDLAGSIQDETFMRPPQGELPKPVELD
jgi:hypothetical protein